MLIRGTPFIEGSAVRRRVADRPLDVASAVTGRALECSIIRKSEVIKAKFILYIYIYYYYYYYYYYLNFD